MFNERHYVPILKWKRGEKVALEALSDTTKQLITPVIEIVPIPYDYANDCYDKTIEEHLQNIGDQIYTSWGNERPIFLDLYWIDDIITTATGEHPLDYVLRLTRSRGLNIIPVTGTNRNIQYQHAIQRAISNDRLGICLRLEDGDFININRSTAQLLNEFHLEPENVDIIIDFKSISPEVENIISMSAIGLVNQLANINRWRSLTVSGSAFPGDLGQVEANTVSNIPRTEWGIWNTLYSNRDRLNRMPTFGDYAVANPMYTEIDPRIMQMSANIRYTCANEWMILKGVSVRRSGYDQYYNLSAELVRSPRYYGPTFSWGDQYIFDCSERRCSCGNAETWRRVATNHHITVAANQISNLFLT